MPNTDLRIAELWYSNKQAYWLEGLSNYWRRVQPANLLLEQQMDSLELTKIKALDERGWFDFLYNEYFVWKYTAKNRLATTRRCLKDYALQDCLSELSTIKEQLLAGDLRDIGGCLETAKSIRGLGYAGASGLLSLLFPQWFGTVDQFVVEALLDVSNLPEKQRLERINKDNISVRDAILLIEIMRRKALENNERFESNIWTPRKIDQVLWGYRRM